VARAPGADQTAPGLAALAAAYPDHLHSAGGNTLVWHDGTRMQYDDGVQGKSPGQLLNSPDLQDQMSVSYPTGPIVVPSRGSDPGRIRYEPFFKKMYGSSPAEVEKNLARVRWLGGAGSLRVTRINGVSDRLRAVSDELEQLPENVRKYVNRPAGGYLWRVIAGTSRLSPHSFGIAVDINTEYADYWRWSSPGPFEDITYRNRIPVSIVEIFERHGFVWGGRWYHYDTMHFEYRPELLQNGKSLLPGSKRP
jgi:hypothetical protein